MIILRNKQFSLRERNRVKEKASASKDQLEERNLGEKPEGNHNEFHQDRPNVHTSHSRTRLYRNFSKREYPYEYNPQYSSDSYFKEAKLAYGSIPKYAKGIVTSKKRQEKLIQDGNYTPPSEEAKKAHLKMMRKAGVNCIKDGLYYGRKNLEHGIRKKIKEIKDDNKKKK